MIPDAPQHHAPGSQSPAPSPRPPRGPSLWLILGTLILVVGCLALGAYYQGPLTRGWQKINALVSAKAADDHDHSADASHSYYTCGMHPWVILDKPGLCPICNMKLEVLDPAKFSGEVTVDPVVAQNIGIRTSPVEIGPVVRTLRTVGSITYDQTRIRDVTTKVGGWIEKLYVDTPGQSVKIGDPLFRLYSPELYAAQQEYLIAWKSWAAMGAVTPQDTVKNSSEMVDATRTKLEYFDISPTQIDSLQKRGTPEKTMTLASPASGIVIAKDAIEGIKMEPGMRAYQVADLSKVWVMVTLYEYQLPFVDLGQEAVMSLTYIPGQTFTGKVIYIYPYLNEMTRQVEVRLEFDNPHGLLKPGMYATIELFNTLARNRVLAPVSAILDTGQRKVAFVSQGEGRFEPRNVRTGVRAQNDRIEILDGLKPGEQVVTTGQFLLDSEANTREALARMIKGTLAGETSGSPTATTQPATTAPATGNALTEAMSAKLIHLIESYFGVQDMLASDTTQGLDAPARAAAKDVDELLAMAVPGRADFWSQHEEIATVRGKALELAKAAKLADARLAFVDMSVALSKFVRSVGVPVALGKELQELHCPMYREDQGGTIWLQTAGKVRNPYYGKMMLGCFDKRQTLPIAGESKP